MIYQVKRDGEVRFEGSHNECFEWLLKNQSQSTAWAIQHEGWKIESKKYGLKHNSCWPESEEKA